MDGYLSEVVMPFSTSTAVLGTIVGGKGRYLHLRLRSQQSILVVYRSVCSPIPDTMLGVVNASLDLRYIK